MIRIDATPKRLLSSALCAAVALGSLATAWGCSSENTSSATVSALNIRPTPCVVQRTESKKLSVEATMRDGTKRDVTNEANWTTDNTNTLTVSGDGTVVGVSAGVTEVKAEYQGATTAEECTVTP